MKIYVASAFGNKADVRHLYAVLRAAGHEITHDWTLEDASHLALNSPEFWRYIRDCGDRDLQGIDSADAVIVLVHPEMRDTRFEMGWALAKGKPVYVLDSDRALSVFLHRGIQVASIAELLTRLG